MRARFVKTTSNKSAIGLDWMDGTHTACALAWLVRKMWDREDSVDHVDVGQLAARPRQHGAGSNTYTARFLRLVGSRHVGPEWPPVGRHRVVLVGERETHAARLGWTGVAYWRALRLKEHVGLFAVGRIQMILRFSSRKERSQECFVFFFRIGVFENFFFGRKGRKVLEITLFLEGYFKKVE
jgi:hypothetical protein